MLLGRISPNPAFCSVGRTLSSVFFCLKLIAVPSPDLGKTYILCHILASNVQSPSPR